MVKTRHSHEAEDHSKEEFLSVENSTKHTRQVSNDQENGSDDSGVVQFRPTRTRGRREVQPEPEDLSPRTKRAAAKRVSYVEDCIDEVQNGEDFMYSTRRRRSHKPVISEDDDSAAEDESPKQAANYTGNASPRRGRAAKSPVFKDVPRSRRKTSDYLVVHPSPSRQLKQEQLDELEASGTRRSVRQRRQLYGTLNEKQLDSVHGPEASFAESIQRRKRRRLDVEEEEGHEEDEKREEEEPGEDGFTDMYSRVKRKRKTVKRDMYGIPIEGESSEEEDSDDSGDESSDDEDEKEDDNEEKEEESGPKSYYLRQNKPRTQLYNAPVEGPKRRRNIFNVHDERPHSPVRRKRRSKLPSLSYLSPARRNFMSPSRRKRDRKRTAFHGSSSSTSSSDSSSDEEKFQRRKAKSMMKARNRCLPMNFVKEDLAGSIVMRDRQRIGASLADIDPMTVDRSVTFDSVGGLGKHIQALKEMVVFPLLYPEIFERFKINPPRGVLFYGPPGTGKTLVARALANECSTGERKVAFYMRKGADCLSKWVGESERQLRLLFDQAYQSRPSIIFFDEIDGLAPVRSSRQDQIHSSIVSTLLALMDGLDSRGEIVVIGATNRIDSIDPALRRPGRFDREFLFPLPSLSARSQILKINTKEWNPKLSDNFVAEVAEKCVGYCGADVRALCTEAALLALRRRYPQIYTSSEKLQIDVSSINVSAKDFFFGMKNIVPTAQRSVTSLGRSLSVKMAPLLQPIFTEILLALGEIFPSVVSQLSSLDGPDTGEGDLESDAEGDDMSIYEQKNRRKKTSLQPQTQEGNFLNLTSYAYQHPSTNRPRLMLTGSGDQGQSSHIGPAILHHLEQLPVHTLDLPSLFAVSARSPEESCAQIFREARRTCPSIIYLPHINQWWNILNDTVRTTLLTLIQDLDPSSPLLMLATSEEKYEELDYSLQELFENYAGEVISMRNPTEEERRNFFKDLLLSQATRPPPQKKVAAERMLEVLPVAPPPEPRQLTEREIGRLREQEEATLRELRLFLRDVLNKLGQDRKFGIFTKPVEIEDVPDYYDIIKKPMDLSTMMSKIDLHHYQCAKEFMEDIDLICANALEYNPDKDQQSRVIRHRACALRDTAYAITKTELDPEFEKTCLDVVESRKKRGEDGAGTAPAYYHTRPLNTGPFHPLAVIKHPTPSTSNGAQNSVTSSPVRTSRRLHGNDTDELPPLEEVERKARMLRRLRKEQNSPEKDSAQSTKEETKDETENTLNTKSTEKDRVSVKSSSGSKFPFRRNLSSSLSKKPVKKSIWDSSRYSTRRKRKRRRVSVDVNVVENNLDQSENESENVENDNEEVNGKEQCSETSQAADSCERLAVMDTSSPVQNGSRSPQTRQHSGGISTENRVHEKETSQKETGTNYLIVDVDMKSPEEGQKSPSRRSDGQRSSQRSPRPGQRSPAKSDAHRSPARSEGHRSPARSDSQKSPRADVQTSPLLNHDYAKPVDQEGTNTPESPQRSHRPGSGQRSRSPRGCSGGRSPRRLEMETSTETNVNKEQSAEGESNKLTPSETAQSDDAVQLIPQDSVSQDTVLSQGVASELTVCDSGIGSSESSGDSNDSTGKAKELLKAQEETLKDSNKPTDSGTNNENTPDKSMEEEQTQEDSPKFRVTRARIQSRSQQKALEVLQESTQHLVIDRERLVRLLDTTVELTEDYTVSRLEKLHSIFSQSIYQHRLDVDKTQMIQEMEQKLQQFTAHINRQRNSNMLTNA